MALVTLQLIEGLERGRVFTDLATPVTIGREDDNLIRLNDERISRFHAKIQEDGGRVILTDLDSTNGTRVNGHPIQMRVLQFGDQLSIGRCLLVYGSPEQIAQRLRDGGGDGRSMAERSDHTLAVGSDVFDPFGPPAALSGDWPAELGELFPHGPPDPPSGLRPVQRAEMSDFLAYAHEQIRIVLQSLQEEPTEADDAPQTVRIGWAAWQRLLKLEMELAVYMRKIADPEG